MPSAPTPSDPIAQLVAKYQSNGHQGAPVQQQPVSQPQQKNDRTGFAGKTLWDRLNLLGVLLVPLILGAGTIIITAQQSAISQSQHESDLSIANNQFQEALLRSVMKCQDIGGAVCRAKRYLDIRDQAWWVISLFGPG